MSRALSRAMFLMLWAFVAFLIVAGVYQVPQPWRGILVAWLLFGCTLGLMILRVVRHHYAYKSLQLMHPDRAAGQGGKPIRHAPPARPIVTPQVVSESYRGRAKI